MPDRWNTLQWDGSPGHYEVYYLTLTDPGTGIGFWIRYTMVAPLEETEEAATCSLWFMATDPANPAANVGEKVSFPVDRLEAERAPFRLKVEDAVLTDRGMEGSLERDGRRFSWDLSWEPRLDAYGHVHPALRATKIAKTILFLPHPDVGVSGRIDIDGRAVEIAGARGGQAHLWGSKHASRWAWVHCSDFNGSENSGRRQAGDRVRGGMADSFIDGVSVFVPRFGRELGPNTPVVARVGGRDLLSISPLAVQRNESDFELEGWRFEARARGRKLAGTVTTRREDLVGVTYHDPDGELAYCYNTEIADLQLEVFERRTPWSAWRKTRELRSDGRAHFEYAQREPIEGVELKVN